MCNQESNYVDRLEELEDAQSLKLIMPGNNVTDCEQMSPQCFSVYHLWFWSFSLGIVIHTCNFSAQEAWEGEGSGIQNQTGLQRTYRRQIFPPPIVFPLSVTSQCQRNWLSKPAAVSGFHSSQPSFVICVFLKVCVFAVLEISTLLPSRPELCTAVSPALAKCFILCCPDWKHSKTVF